MEPRNRKILIVIVVVAFVASLLIAYFIMVQQGFFGPEGFEIMTPEEIPLQQQVVGWRIFRFINAVIRFF